MSDVQYFTGTKEAISGVAEPVKYFLTAGLAPAIVSLPPEQDSTTAPNGADVARKRTQVGNDQTSTMHLWGDTLPWSLHGYSVAEEMPELKGTKEAPRDCFPSEHRG